ncbi:uncharacterized protein [Aegilops tauschii subsp. strangulata]|uniref:uncharacterized protein isoform X1 n=1 Tax=Aegilops tauschii subsp. strangulata TaxID=200361 RepID=UPI003CC84530
MDDLSCRGHLPPRAMTPRRRGPSSSATSSAGIHSTGAALHRRDRRIYLAYGRRCPAPDLPHRSSSAPPDASSASPCPEPGKHSQLNSPSPISWSTSLDPETDAAPVIDYVTDDTSSFSAELSDGGAQDPDVTFDDNCYYTEGAYYYVEAADDQE